MTTTIEDIAGLGIRTITRCDRCNRANGWGVMTHPVVNPVNGVQADYCTHCLIVRTGDSCMIPDCDIEECWHMNNSTEIN